MKKLILITILCFGSILLADEISGVTYFSYSISDINRDNTEQGFELNRVYLTYKKEISDKASFTFQADMQNKNEIETTAYYMYIKNAKLDFNIFDKTKLIIGMQGMNMFNISEKTWGNRFLSKTAMDANKWSESADLGMGLSQSFGDISASLLITNGEGYKSKSEDNNEKISLQAMYGQKRLDKKDGFNIGGVYSTLTYISVEDDETTTEIDEEEAIPGTVMGIFGGFSRFGARVGFDYNIGTDLDLEFIEDDENTPGIDETIFYGESSTLMSFYANYSLSFIEGLSVIGRYDMLDASIEDNANTSDIDESAEDNVTTMTAGLIYHCTDGLSIAPYIVQTTVGTGNPMMDFNLSFQFQF
jgi:hypothetical protein